MKKMFSCIRACHFKSISCSRYICVVMYYRLIHSRWYFCQYAVATLVLKQGHSHQNLSGQAKIISQASTYSDFQFIVIVVHSIHSILQEHRNWPGRPRNCRIKVSSSYIQRAHKTLNARLNAGDEKDVFYSYNGFRFQVCSSHLIIVSLK